MRAFVYALRFLGKRWGLTTVAVLVMGLGISLTASMYAIIEGVILRGLFLTFARWHYPASSVSSSAYSG